MPVPTIFLIDDGGEIVEMSDQPYDSERLFRELLAKYPNVLASDQMSGSAPLKWLLGHEKPEFPMQTAGPNVGRWITCSLTKTECQPSWKSSGLLTLASAVRLVGQMLDYAANASSYWRLETIRELFEQTCGDSDPNLIIADFAGTDSARDGDGAIARFWSTVETNLRAGNVRLIFAADEIPPELRRIVEFLNQQMNPAEVLAIEIRQYVGKGVRNPGS